MEKLIDTLRAQHRALEATVRRIDDALEVADLVALRHELGKLTLALLAHLETEDAHLYPSLAQAARKKDASLPIHVVDLFAKNMETVSAALKAFLERHGTISPETMSDFTLDWPLVRRMLADRIDNEESTLYPLYQSWVLDPRPA